MLSAYFTAAGVAATGMGWWRPEISGFVSVAPPANGYDFTFLAPCPASGLIVHGTDDAHVPESDVAELAQRLSAQRAITVEYGLIEGASHLFENHLDELRDVIETYLDSALAPSAAA